MLTPHVPTGPRNPNGYTADEIMRAIRGLDGSREVSYRYELLDQHLNYKKDLDNILGGSVQMQYISEIKRTASFDMRGDGDIDWLFDHVKPYMRFKMPARMVKDGILLDSLWYNSFDGPNNTDVTPGNSVNYGDAIQSVDGTVRYTTAGTPIGSASLLLGTDDGTGGPAGEFGSGRIALNFRARSSWKISSYAFVPNGGNFTIYPAGLGLNEFALMRINGGLGSEYRLGGVNINHIGSNLHNRPIRIEAVNDGFRCRYSLWWNAPLTGAPDFTVSEDSSWWPAIQVCYVSGGGFNSNPARADEFRVSVPGEVEYLPRTRPVWENTFNGDADMVVDSDSLRFFGNVPNDIGGYLAYSDEWAAQGDASLELGEGGLGNGYIQANTPPRSEWSTRFHVNIPEGGKFYFAPSSEGNVPPPEEIPYWNGPISKNGAAGDYGWGFSVSTPVPSGTAQGDFMVATVTTNDNQTGSLTVPESWTEVTKFTVGDTASVYVFSKVAGPSEPESYEWAFDVEHWCSASISSWTNVQGIRSIGYNQDYDVSSIALPSLVAEEGDALLAVGFDWGETGKSWSGSMTTDLDMARGQLVSSIEDLPAGSTPSYTLERSASGVSRMAAIAVVLEHIPEPSTPFRGVNWIVLDDATEEYTIAGVDVSEFHDQIFGTPIRIEMETDGSDYSWRVYSTDPDGNAPDINWYGNSSGWGNMQSFLFQGGGSGLDPTYLDSVLIGRMISTDVLSKDDVNYVEFPLGVFMLTSPTREADKDDVVTREVEAYDRTKLFIDDRLTERVTLVKGTVYTDVINFFLGGVPKIVEPSTWVVGRERSFEVGTSIKEVIDRCAESINYHTLRFDEEGRAVVQPYVSPGDRSPEFDYSDNEVSIMYPDMQVEFDAFDIANVWIVSVSDPDGEPLYVKLENHDPSNPFSIPRRGRRIVDFREEEEAGDQASLMRKAKRIQFEANREYENISFNTLSNPLHSANDCYTINFGPLGVREKYTEINWEMPLSAGATMTHTARRVVKLDPEDDPGFIEDHLQVNGALTAGNIAWGSITVPTGGNAGKPVRATVTGLDLKGTGRVDVFVTPWSTVAHRIKGCTTQKETPQGFEVWMYRSTNANTTVHWMAMRKL